LSRERKKGRPAWMGQVETRRKKKKKKREKEKVHYLHLREEKALCRRRKNDALV